MNVGELIRQLEKIPNKDAPVLFFEVYAASGYMPDDGWPVTDLDFDGESVTITNENSERAGD